MAAWLALMLAGCGGAGDVRPAAEADAARSDGGLGNEYRGPLSGSSTTGSREEIGIAQLARYEAAMMLNWQRTEIEGFDWFTPWEHDVAPVVRIARGATADEIAVVRRAVQILNRALPDDMELSVETNGAVMPGRTHNSRAPDSVQAQRWRRVESGEILIDFGTV